MELAATLRWFDSCLSTNDEAMSWAGQGAPHGACVWARSQTRGRGQRARRWVSEPGQLTCSFILRPALRPDQAPPVTLLAGLALHRMMNRLGVKNSMKWPNDIIVRDNKLAGILTEMSTSGSDLKYVVVGIGVNLLKTASVQTVGGISLEESLGASVGIYECLNRLAIELESTLSEAMLAQKNHKDSLIKHALDSINCALYRQPLAFYSGNRSFEGRAERVLPDGSLVVTDEWGDFHTLTSATSERPSS